MNIYDLNDYEKDLLPYISDPERIKDYVCRMRTCDTLKDVESRVLIPMVRNEQIPTDKLSKKDFYERLLPFLGHIRKISRNTLWNHMTDLAALLNRQEAVAKKATTIEIFADISEIQRPNPGETVCYELDITITAPLDHSEALHVHSVLKKDLILMVA